MRKTIEGFLILALAIGSPFLFTPPVAAATPEFHAQATTAEGGEEAEETATREQINAPPVGSPAETAVAGQTGSEGGTVLPEGGTLSETSGTSGSVTESASENSIESHQSSMGQDEAASR